MKITCVCPTFGRAHLLEESVESFRRQWPVAARVELLIVNDCQEQPLRCATPGVRVVNLPERIGDAAAKFNVAVDEAHDADWIAWWEDDDISLPHRLRYSVQAVESGTVDYWKQNRAWLCENGIITKSERNLFFGNAFFRKSLWDEVGGATQGDWADLTPHQKMVSAAGARYAATDCEGRDLIFVYCWSGRGHHDSGHRGTAAERAAAFYAATLADPNFRPGVQDVAPRWKRDYVRLVAEHMRRSHERPA